MFNKHASIICYNSGKKPLKLKFPGNGGGPGKLGGGGLIVLVGCVVLMLSHTAFI